MGKKIGIHSQATKGWYGNFYAASGGQWFKAIGHYPKYPGVNTLARVYYPQNEVDNRVREGAAGAERIFQACLNESIGSGCTWFETPANECSFWDQSVANGVVAFNQRLIQLYHARGWKIVVGAINCGWPRLVKDDGGSQMNMWMNACRGADGLSFHEGGYKDFEKEAPWLCTRYRFTHQYFTSHGLANHPPFFVTEICLDTGGAHQGWQVILGNNIAEYTRQMTWYENQLQQDSYVYGGMVFTTGGEGMGWDTFEWYEAAAMHFANAPYVPGPPPAPPTPPPPPPPPTPPPNPPPNPNDWALLLDVSEYQGAVNWAEVKASGVHGVILRASVARADGTIAKDAKFWQNAAACEQHDIPFGAYHYFRQNVSGQAAFFVNAVYESVASDYFPPLGLWLDCEESALTADKINTGLVAIDQRAAERWGNPVPCGVYTRKSAWKGGSTQGHRRLWVAHWDITDPSQIAIPAGWTNFIVWQYSNNGSIPGISGRVDLDRFHGSEAQFYDWFDLTPPAPPPVPPPPPPAPPPPPPPPNPDEWAFLIDVDEAQGDIDWAQVKENGAVGALLRATVCQADGTLAIDAKFDRNVAACRGLGIPWGAYHGFKEVASGQAAFFVNAVRGASPNRPPLGLWLHCDAALTAGKIALGLEAIDRNAEAAWSGIPACGVYTRAASWPAGADQGARPLWVADWAVSDPGDIAIPLGWEDFILWQFTDTGTIPGIVGNARFDLFHGSEAQFYDWFGLEPPEPPTPPPPPPPEPPEDIMEALNTIIGQIETTWTELEAMLEDLQAPGVIWPEI